jgi:hypothetical protein
MDVILASKEESLADWEAGKTLTFLTGELKDVGENINGR